MCHNRMNGRLALITGGGTGIGAAVACMFAKQGATVIVTGRREEPLHRLTSELEAFGHTGCGYYVGDVSDLVRMEAIFLDIVKKYGTVDALVNCAGIVSRVEDPTTISPIQQMLLIQANIFGTLITNRLTIKFLLDNKRHGTIVNIASIAAHRASAGYATYSATKGAVIAFTRVIALQFARNGIRANSISPGIIDTPMGYVDRTNYDGEKSRLDSLHPLGRMGKPEDIANAALFLSCDESSWITGQDFIVDGGLSIE